MLAHWSTTMGKINWLPFLPFTVRMWPEKVMFVLHHHLVDCYLVPHYHLIIGIFCTHFLFSLCFCLSLLLHGSLFLLASLAEAVIFLLTHLYFLVQAMDNCFTFVIVILTCRKLQHMLRVGLDLVNSWNIHGRLCLYHPHFSAGKGIHFRKKKFYIADRYIWVLNCLHISVVGS